MTARQRCAIYTRKSTEEGLEQSFNSLHAQREACEAYILSQTGEGWVAQPKAYDDGGFSGGNMDRPGLKQLLADIAAGQIDIVVVYKVDRLTRSLADFAKIVELFDARGVCFVSVTQAFNTTSSMGRLTLNVLLSFAQFEREVTGERIRDKVAASKAKGLRMGGHPPLGYDIVEGRLAPNAGEAEDVREIFQRYLDLGSLHDLAREGFRAKRWTNRAAAAVGGGVMSRGALRYLLANPAYLGVTRHKEKQYEDTHPPIIDRGLWDRVQARLAAASAERQAGPLLGERARLEGRLFDDRGNPMVAVHTRKRAKRYRYYISRPKLSGKGLAGSLHRVSAGLIEQFLIDQLKPRLSASWSLAVASSERVLGAAKRVVVGADRLEVIVPAEALAPEASERAERLDDGGLLLRFAFELRRRQGAMILEAPGSAPSASPNPDRALIRAVVMAKTWTNELETGAVASIKALARREGLCNHYASRLLPLAYLAPDLVELIVAGRQPPALSLAILTARPLPLSWVAQRDLWRRLESGVA